MTTASPWTLGDITPHSSAPSMTADQVQRSYVNARADQHQAQNASRWALGTGSLSIAGAGAIGKLAFIGLVAPLTAGIALTGGIGIALATIGIARIFRAQSAKAEKKADQLITPITMITRGESMESVSAYMNDHQLSGPSLASSPSDGIRGILSKLGGWRSQRKEALSANQTDQMAPDAPLRSPQTPSAFKR